MKKDISAIYSSQLNQRRKILRSNKSQLLLIGGVIITILMLSMAVISISIPDITRPVYKKDFISYEFANVREEFGILLKGNMKKIIDDIDPTEPGADFDSLGLPHFDETKDMFIFIEKKHGNYFNAEYISGSYNPGSPGSPKTVQVELTLKNEKETISEVVTYAIS